MGVWDSPPTASEKKAAGVWDTPPTEEELRGASVPAQDNSRIARLQRGDTAEEPEKVNPHGAEALGTSALNRGLFGAGAQVEGASRAVGAWLANSIYGDKGESYPTFSELRKQKTAEAEQRYAKLKGENPEDWQVGDTAVGVAQTFLPGMKSIEGLMALGLLNAAGDKRSESDALSEALTTGVLGKAAEGVGGLIGRAPKAAGQALETAAENNALIGATHAKPQDLKYIRPATRQAMGQELLNGRTPEGERLLGFFETPTRAAPKIASAAEAAGEKLGSYRSANNDFAQRNREFEPDIGKFIQRVEDEVITPLYEEGTKSAKQIANKVRQEISDLYVAKEMGLDLGPANLTKAQRGIAKVAYPQAQYGKGIPPPPPPHQAEMAKVERILEDTMHDSSAKIASAKGETDRYKPLKKKTEALIKTRQLADKGANMEAGNTKLSLRDLATGAAVGAATGNASALAAPVASKIIRRYGRPFLARVEHTIGKLLTADRGAAGLVAKSISTGAKLSGAAFERLVKAAALGDKEFTQTVDDMQQSGEL